MKNADEQAFPSGMTGGGMTKREYFAAKAMQGILSDGDVLNKVCRIATEKKINQESAIALYSINLTDALLRELEK